MATIAYKISTLDGTKALPAHTFDNDPDSGWYRQGAGAIRLSVDNTDVINATSSGIVIPGTLGVTGLITATAGVKFGTTIMLTEGSANVLELASGDDLYLAGGGLGIGIVNAIAGTLVVAVRAAFGVLGGSSGVIVRVGGGTNTTSGTTQWGVLSDGEFSSDATSAGISIDVVVKTEATSFTMATATGVRIKDVTRGAGSTITTQVGLEILSQTKGGTNFAIRTGLGKCLFGDEVEIDGDLNHDGSNIGLFGVAPVARAAAYTQTYSTADRTFSAYTADDESSAYTGAGDSEAKLADLNFLRIAVENLRAFSEDQAALINSLIDDAQAYGLAQ